MTTKITCDFIDSLTREHTGSLTTTFRSCVGKVFGILLTTVMVAGCGTTLNVRDFELGSMPPGQSSIKQDGHVQAAKRIYGGVEMDAIFGTGMLFSESQNDLRAGPIGLYTLAVDLPLSVIGDTLTLPITVPATLDRRRNAVAHSPAKHSLDETRNGDQ